MTMGLALAEDSSVVDVVGAGLEGAAVAYRRDRDGAQLVERDPTVAVAIRVRERREAQRGRSVDIVLSSSVTPSPSSASVDGGMTRKPNEHVPMAYVMLSFCWLFVGTSSTRS